MTLQNTNTQPSKLDAYLKERSTKAKEVFDKVAGDNVNWLLYGPFGVGKTVTASTGRKPMLVYSFDPGGWSGTIIRPQIDNGDIIVTMFENEDPKKPHCFGDFEKQFDADKAAGIFDKLGSVVIDSLTGMADCAIHHVLKLAGKPNTTPTLPDYLTRQVMLMSVLDDFCALPCDFILTAHTVLEKDEESHKLIATLDTSKGMITAVPRKFDEVLVPVCLPKDGDKVEYKLQMLPDSMFKARSRLNSGNLFSKFESPNLMAIRRKAGRSDKHLPKIGD
jgi:hypothetical protein